jgi:carbohydrate kinase (thermoresistant glucokinase family)
LSKALDIPFFDADDFHPASNVEKMSSGIPLDDGDRRPWLEILARRLSEWEKAGGAVLACSALKESYRVLMESSCDESIRWIFLLGCEEVLATRLASRKEHFFDPDLLASQLEALEIPDYGWRIDVESPPRDIVNDIIERLRGL